MIFRVRDWNKYYETYKTRELRNTHWVPVPNKTHGLSYSKLVRYPHATMYLGAWLSILEAASKSAIRGDLSHLCECGMMQLSSTSTEIDVHQPYAALIQTGVCRNLSYVTHLPEADFVEAVPVLMSLEWLEFDADAEPDVVRAVSGAARVEHGCITGAPGADATRKRSLKGREGKGREGNTTANAETDKWFLEEFWPIYPRKVCKGAALKACRKALKTPDDRAKALAKIQHDAPEMLAHEEQYRPHAATWFNQGRWSDAIEASPAVKGGTAEPFYPKFDFKL